MSHAQWARIRDLLPGKAGDPGRTAVDNRLFVNGVLWVLRSGARWSDLPSRYGSYKSVHKAPGHDIAIIRGVHQQGDAAMMRTQLLDQTPTFGRITRLPGRQRFTRWATKGVWEQVFETLTRDRDSEYLMIDSSIVRAHAQAATGKGGRWTRLWGVPEED